MTEAPEYYPALYYLQKSSHLNYLLDLWHSIGQQHTELTKQLLTGTLNPVLFAELVAKILEMWKELYPYDPNLPDYSKYFVNPPKVSENSITWINEAILELSKSLKRLGITEFREVER